MITKDFIDAIDRYSQNDLNNNIKVRLKKTLLAYLEQLESSCENIMIKKQTSSVIKELSK